MLGWCATPSHAITLSQSLDQRLLVWFSLQCGNLDVLFTYHWNIFWFCQLICYIPSHSLQYFDKCIVLSTLHHPTLTLVQVTSDYDSIYQHSINKPEVFWADRAKEYLQWEQPFHSVVEESGMKWFGGGKINVSGKVKAVYSELNCIKNAGQDSTKSYYMIF